MVLTGAGDLGRISPETQRRVLEAARQLDYVPATHNVRVGWPAARQAASRQPPSPLLLGVHTFEPIFPAPLISRPWRVTPTAGGDDRVIRIRVSWQASHRRARRTLG